MYKQIDYFGGLNALRFFAAYTVVLHHAEQIRLKYGLFDLKAFSLFNNGGLAVTFFFVLSGFLITYLLLRERRDTGDVSIRDFYIRRILRIWPLYFLLVFLGTLAIPFLLKLIGYSYEMPYTFGDVIGYYVFFAPFMVNILYGHHFLEPLWSIGVEELFYILWAPLFKFFRGHVLTILLSVIAVKIALLVGVYLLEPGAVFEGIVHALKFEAMAIGGLTAYIVYHTRRDISESVVFSVPVQVFLLFFLALRLFAFRYLIDKFDLFNHLYTTFILSDYLMMLIFAWLIVNISLNSRSLFRLENRTLNLLGHISYGIYMYHMLVIFGTVLVFKDVLNAMENVPSTVVFYLLITMATVLVSYVSRHFFEDWFLRLKRRFTYFGKRSEAAREAVTAQPYTV